MESKAICQELHRELPSFSAADSERTVIEGANFLTTFQAVCEGKL